MKIWKRILCFVLAFVVFAYNDAIITMAQTVAEDSQSVEMKNGDISTENLSTVSNDGTSLSNEDFEYVINENKITITKYIGTKTELEIPEKIDDFPVTGIASNCFNGTGITEITITSNLESANNAFKGSNVETVTIAEGVTSIPNSLFHSAAKLTSVTIEGEVVSIGAYAFDGCSSLSSVTLPESLEEIGAYAFDGCSSLSNINMPSGLKKIGIYCFRGTVITEITITPNLADAFGAFSGSAVETVTIEEGVTHIPRGILLGATTLTSVTIPSGVVSIGDYAFDGCSSLSNINVPDSLKKIGIYCFRGTVITDITITPNLADASSAFSGSAVETVTIAEGVTHIPRGILSGVTTLTSVTIPSGVVSIGDYAFENCSNLSSITLPESLEELSYRAFAGCSSLESITMPNNLKKIGSFCFQNCSLLRTIYWNDILTNVDGTAFQNLSANLCVYVKENSPALYRVIELELPFSLIGSNSNPSDTKVLNAKESSYYTTTNRVKQGQYNTFVVKYSCDTNKFTNLQNPCIEIYIPKSMNLNNSLIQLDGRYLNVNEYALNDKTRMLKIPVKKDGGEIKLSLKAMGTGKIITYARLTYVTDDVTISESIDSIMLDVPSLSFNCSDKVPDGNIKICGTTTPSESIEIYINGTYSTTITANKNGNFESAINVNTPGKYKIMAVLSGREDISMTKTCKYELASPSISEFKFYYQQHERQWKEKDLLEKDSGSKIITINPAYEMRFVLGIENDSLIKNVYVTSKKNGETKYIKAEKVSAGKYVAHGYFDSSNRQYVPGELSVCYQLDDGTFDGVSSEVSVEKQKEQVKRIVSSLQEEDSKVDVDDISVENVSAETDGNTTTYVSTISNGTESQEVKVKVEKSVTSTAHTKESLEQLGYRTYATDGSQIVYAKSSYDPNNEQGVIQYIISTAQSGFILDGSDLYTISVSLVDSVVSGSKVGFYDNLFSILGFVSEAGYFKHKCDLIERDPSLTSAQKQQLKNQYKAEGTEDFIIVGTSLIIGLLVPASIPLAPLISVTVSLACSVIGGIVDESNMIAGIVLLFTIDPSGYVYEGVTENRLKNVKATIYYKSSLNDPSAIVWDAALYGQKNPIYTEEDGSYAWDVPEGYWQVKYELEGYDTAYSEWMPVPPEQTDVNVGLLSKDAPVIDTVSLTRDKLEISFSQYMNPETISGIVLKNSKGSVLSYTLDYNRTEKDANGKVLAKNYTLLLKNTLNAKEQINIIIPYTLTSYNGKKVAQETRQETVQDIVSISAEDDVSIKLNTETERLVTLSNYHPKYTLSVVSPSDVALQASIGNVNYKGEAVLKLNGTIPGEYIIRIIVDGTSMEKAMKVTVLDEADSSNVSNPEKIEIEDVGLMLEGANNFICTEKNKVSNYMFLPKTNGKYKFSFGSNYQPTCKVKIGNREITVGADSILEGTAGSKIEITICDSKGTGRGKLNINRILSLKTASVTLPNNSYQYTGKNIEPVPSSVVLNGKKLVLNKDYKLTYSNNKTIGTAAIILTGIGNYDGSISINFKIVPVNASKAKIALKKSKVNYNGKSQKIAVKSVTLNGKAISAKDYSVSYTNHKKAGKATVTLKFKNNYTGTAKANFTINKVKSVLKNTSKTMKYSSVKKKKQTYSIIKLTDGGKVSATYLKNGKISKSVCKKYISVSKKGIVTVKKGAEKGTYKVKITVKAKGSCKGTQKTITIRVK